MASYQGKFSLARHEILNPAIHRGGDLAVLAFDWQPYGVGDARLPAWNATSVYGRRNGEWRIVHVHWSAVTSA